MDIEDRQRRSNIRIIEAPPRKSKVVQKGKYKQLLKLSWKQTYKQNDLNLCKGDKMCLGHMTRTVNSKTQSVKTIRLKKSFWYKAKWPSNVYGIRPLRNIFDLKYNGVNAVTDT